MAARWAAAEAGPESAEAFRRYVPLHTQWRRLPYLDPGLPTVLLSADWSAVVSRQVFQQLHGILVDPSLRHVAESRGRGTDVTGLTSRIWRHGG
ncbi:PaaX family transcriptional regulator C-terminal domain-containing protein [Streptomyces sp. NPDC046332]|uniref:PaaX family transcriptional regulator C-terminal domain-containing protein n=1 Tax=Streptomyces sp. NPDC046332 TaxID=3155133 RepID=UPI0033D58696